MKVNLKECFKDFGFLHFNRVFLVVSLPPIQYHQCRFQLYTKKTSNLCKDSHLVSEVSFKVFFLFLLIEEHNRKSSLKKKGAWKTQEYCKLS